MIYHLTIIILSFRRVFLTLLMIYLTGLVIIEIKEFVKVINFFSSQYSLKIIFVHYILIKYLVRVQK